LIPVVKEKRIIIDSSYIAKIRSYYYEKELLLAVVCDMCFLINGRKSRSTNKNSKNPIIQHKLEIFPWR
jgi:hypothetical protein